MNSVKLKEAEKLVETFINKNYNVPGDCLVILENKTIEKEYGWYFFSSSKKYLKTQSFKDKAVGNGVILVEKESGQIIQFGTAFSSKYYIQEYENFLKSLK